MAMDEPRADTAAATVTWCGATVERQSDGATRMTVLAGAGPVSSGVAGAMSVVQRVDGTRRPLRRTEAASRCRHRGFAERWPSGDAFARVLLRFGGPQETPEGQHTGGGPRR